MVAKERAKWWIVSTHVLTTGFVMPFLVGKVGGAVVGGYGLRSLPAFALLLAIQASGYIAGTYYSLGYLRRSTITDDWRGCITPSVISFVVLSVIGFVANAIRVNGSVTAIGVLVVFHGVIIVAFAKITASGFHGLQAQASH